MANKEAVTISECAADPIVGSKVSYLVPERGEGVEGWAMRVDEELNSKGSGYRPLHALASMSAAGKVRNGPALTFAGPVVRVAFDSGHSVTLRPDGIYLGAPGHRVSLKEAKSLDGRWVEYSANVGALTEAVEALMRLEIKSSASGVKLGGDLSDL